MSLCFAQTRALISHSLSYPPLELLANKKRRTHTVPRGVLCSCEYRNRRTLGQCELMFASNLCGLQCQQSQCTYIPVFGRRESTVQSSHTRVPRPQKAQGETRGQKPSAYSTRLQLNFHRRGMNGKSPNRREGA